jgi:nucleotide-binding universal stress UspA family protein
MTIICGTDFSAASEAACSVAALLARKRDETLIIVHAMNDVRIPPGSVPTTLLEDLRASAERGMQELAKRIEIPSGRLTTRIQFGTADETILSAAEDVDARLVVLGSVGQRGGTWMLGSTAERVVSRSLVPVFLVRGDFPAAEWIARKRPLRVAVAADFAASTESAVEWASHLPEHGPCEFVLAHVSWPPEEHERLAIEAPMHLDRTHPLVADVIQRDLASLASRLPGAGETEVIVESNMGRSADAIAQLAKREHADVLVVGRRSEGRHWWDESVSRGVVRRAPMSVVCVPEVTGEARLPEPRFRRILAATDFSPLGNAAIACALRLADADGEILLVHALDDAEGPDDERSRRLGRLERLEQLAGARPEKRSVRCEILSGEDPARLIGAAAERFGADMICVGSRGRSGLARALLGSVSQSLLLSSRRPVLVVQWPV